MATNTPSFLCPKCAVRIRIPADMIGRKVVCPKCEAVFIASADTREPAPVRATASVKTGHIVVHCSSCSTKVKLPGAAEGKKFLCPRCRAVLQADAAPRDAAPTDDELLKLTPEQSLPPSTVIRPLSEAPRQKCPSCGKSYPADARLCTDCGVYLKTGRGILTTQDENLDQIYVWTENLLRILSFLIFIGVYPVASEAFGLRKPWVVRGIALLTVLVGAVHLYSCTTGSPAQATFDKMMLWGGDPAQLDELRTRLLEELEADDSTSPEEAKQIRELRNSILSLYQNSVSEFHPYQLITHAFLHDGPLHLAGNMLFLMVLGARVNALIGNIWTLILYPLLAILAGIAHTISIAHGPSIPMLGASGAVMGLAGMYLVLFPVHQVHMAAWLRWGILFPFRFSFTIFALRGFWVVLFYIAFDVAYTVFHIEDGVAHWAHLGGFIAGTVFAMLLLICRQVDARGGDLFSTVLGRHAWKIIGRPRGATAESR